MFARQLARAVKAPQVAAWSRKSVSQFSTVQENTIRLIFVDREGNRVTVPARVGKTLLEAALLHKVDIEGPCEGGGAPTDIQRTEKWNESVFGEGPTCFFCHVQIPSAFHHLLPRETAIEREGLKDVWEEEYTSSSRLACQIVLEKKHDGMVVFVPDAPPVDVI
eukprot:gene601-417_t